MLEFIQKLTEQCIGLWDFMIFPNSGDISAQASLCCWWRSCPWLWQEVQAGITQPLGAASSGGTPAAPLWLPHHPGVPGLCLLGRQWDQHLLMQPVPGQPLLHHPQSLLGQTFSITTSLYFGGALRAHLPEFQANLVPSFQIHFFLMTY